MVSSTNLMDSKPLSIPLAFGNVKSEALISNPSLYRSLVGKLFYLTFTHPDISYSVNLLGQFMQAPHEKHFPALCVIRYLKCTASLDLFFPAHNDLVL